MSLKISNYPTLAWYNMEYGYIFPYFRLPAKKWATTVIVKVEFVQTSQAVAGPN